MGLELKVAALAIADQLERTCGRDLLTAIYTENNGNVEFIKQNGDTVTLNKLIGDGKDIGSHYEHVFLRDSGGNDQNLGGNNPQRRTFGAGSDDVIVSAPEVTEHISGDFATNVMAHAIYATSELPLDDEKTIKVCVGTKEFDPKKDKADARDHLIECLHQTLNDLNEKSPFASGDSYALLDKKIQRLSNLIKDFERTKKARGGLFKKKKGANEFDLGKLFAKARSAGVRFVAGKFENRVAYHTDSEIDQAVLVQQILNLAPKHSNKKDVKAYVKSTATTDMNTTQLEDYKTGVAALFSRNKLERALKLPVKVMKGESGESYVEKKRVVEVLADIESSMSPDGPATRCPYFVGSIYNRYYQKAIKKDVSDFKKAISKKKGDAVTIEDLQSAAQKCHVPITLSTGVKENTDNQTYNDNGEFDNASFVQNVDDNSDNDTHSDADFYKRDPFLENYDGLDDEDKTGKIARYLSESSTDSDG